MVNLIPEHDAGALIESIIVKGDLAKLTPEERTRYYIEVCKSAGLNPLMKPFEYITLNGKLTLYALRGCTDQLRQLHAVSVDEMTGAAHGDIWVVTCKVRNADGRTDMSTGAVSLGALKGEALANALMKAETKAKRRATLSLCGLGLLDETEVETIPGARIGEPLPPHDPTTGEVSRQSRQSRQLPSPAGSKTRPLSAAPIAQPSSSAGAAQGDPGGGGEHPRQTEAVTAWKALKGRISTAPTLAALDNVIKDATDELTLIRQVKESRYDELMKLATDREDTLHRDDGGSFDEIPA